MKLLFLIPRLAATHGVEGIAIRQAHRSRRQPNTHVLVLLLLGVGAVVALTPWTQRSRPISNAGFKIPANLPPHGLAPMRERQEGAPIAEEDDVAEWAQGRLPNVFLPSDSQEAIQAALDRDGVAYLAPGEYTLTETLRLPKQYGCALIGLGGGGGALVAGQRVHPGLVSKGAVRLNWAGDSDSPMVRVSGCDWRLDGLNLYGGGSGPSAGVKAAIGLQIDNDLSGLGPGKGHAPCLSFHACETGIQFGRHGRGDNADVTSFDRLSFVECGTCVKAIAPLCYAVHVGYVRNQRCGVVFDWQGGGSLYCHGAEILAQGGTLLRLGDVTPNASSFVLRGVLVDAPAAKSGFKLVECTERSWADVTIQAHLPHLEYQTPIAKLVGPVSLELDRVSNLRPGAVEGVAHRAGTPVVIADGCRLRGDWGSQAALLVGDGAGVMRGCFTASGSLYDGVRGPIPSTEN